MTKNPPKVPGLAILSQTPCSVQRKPASLKTTLTVRSRTVVYSGALFIVVNFLLALFNFLAGSLSHSLAIISDAAHSLIDSASGFIIIISEKLASSQKFSHHRTRIERTATISVALIIIAVGIHLIIEAIAKILAPEPVDYPPLTLVILVIGLILKYALAVFLTRTGRKLKSSVLIASGAETMNDAWISVAVLTSALVYLLFKIDLEAVLSLFISVVIIKIGLEFIFPHLSAHHHHPFESDPDHDHCKKA